MAFRPDYTPITRAAESQSRALAGGLTGLAQGIKEKQAKGAKAERVAYLKGLSQEAVGGDVAAQEELAFEAPEINQRMMDILGARDERTQKGMIHDAAQVLSLHGAGQQQQALNYLDQRIQAIDARGGDSSHTRQARDVYAQNPEQGAQLIRSELQAMVDPKAFAEAQFKGIDEEVQVGAQEILEDGTIIQSTKKGPVVYGPTGEKLKGQAAADAVKIARSEKVSNLRKAAGAKKQATLEEELALKAKVEANIISAKAAAQISAGAFDKLQVIDTNIRNLREGVQLLRDGAETGAVASKLPSVRAASVKLDNLQGRLGLDVLHSTTFGALSAAELKFALSTALPQKLNRDELIEWMEDKAAAQEKLSDYLESAAIYLGTPGNTVAGWIEKKRNARKSAEQSTQEPVTVTTQVEFDNLPSGAVYIEDGQQYRKQ